MNLLYTINYLIFSVFFTLFMVEIGFALVTFLNYDKYKAQISALINPIWEVTGTFAVFYLVNFEVSYPTLLNIVGNAYVVPLLIAAIFIILRNVFLISSEFISEIKAEHKLRFVYSISTIIAAVLAIATLSSGLSGIGISLGTNTINSAFLFNPFNILLLISLVLLSFSLANGILKLEGFNQFGIIAEFAGFIIAFLAFYTYLPNFAPNLSSNMLLVAISLILLLLAIVLQLRKTKYSGLFNIIFILLLINLFGATIYPYIFGISTITTYITTSTLANPAILITIIGGTVVALSLLALIYVNYIKK